jgi:hypothetical protein
MTVSVEITVAEKSDAQIIPRRSLYAEKADPYVLSLVDGHARKTRVELGLVGDESVEVAAGLSPKDLVITAPAGSVEPGAAVQAANSSASEN